MGKIRVAIVTLAVVLAGCDAAAPAATDGSRSPTPPPVEVKVAFVKDLSVPDADEHALPASRGVELAFETAEVTGSMEFPVVLDQLDLSEDRDELATVAADPAFVAVIVAPGVDPAGLDLSTGLPVVSLSGLGEGGGPAFVRLVPPLEAVADALAGRLRRSRPCILSEDPRPDPFGPLLTERVRPARQALIEPADAATFASEQGCDLVVWGGGPDAAAEAAQALAPAGVPLVGGDRLLDPDFLSTAGASAEGALAFCPCADVSTSTDLAARRFIQDYQSEYGAAPGGYAAEGWDAGTMLVETLSASGPTRSAAAARLAAMTRFDGLAHGYRFDPTGELAGGRSLIRVYRVEGGRWRLLAAEAGRCLGFVERCGTPG